MVDDGLDSDDLEEIVESIIVVSYWNGIGEDLYVFGSNRNLFLGFGDEDDC